MSGRFVSEAGNLRDRNITNLEVVIRTQKTWCRPAQTLCSPQSSELCSYDPEGLVLLCSPSPLALTFFLPLPWDSLSCEGRVLMEVSHSEMCVPRSLSMWHLAVLSALFPSAGRGSIFDDGWRSHSLDQSVLWEAQLQGGSDDCSRLCVGHVSSSPLKTFSMIKIVNAYLRELGCPGSVNDEQL